MKSSCQVILASTIVLTSPIPAAACGMCVFSAFDQYVTPIFWWTFLALFWFLATSLLATLFKVRFPLTPTFWKAALLAVFAIVLGPSFFGPIPVFFLGLLALIAFIRSWVPRSGPGIRMIRFTGVLVLGIACVLLVWNYSLQTERGRDGFIVQWGNTVPALQAFATFEENPPNHLPAFRKIARDGEGELQVRSARYLAEFGNVEDLHLAGMALAKAKSSGTHHYDEQQWDIAADIIKMREMMLPASDPSGH